jgi:hypothetical protein
MKQESSFLNMLQFKLTLIEKDQTKDSSSNFVTHLDTHEMIL